MAEYDKGPETIETDAIDDQSVVVWILFIKIGANYRGNDYNDNWQEKKCKHEAN